MGAISLLQHFFVFVFIQCIYCDEIFESDLGEDMKIGLADGGYQSVKLKCGSDSMHVNLLTDEDFAGVIYTRGSFYDRDTSCFLDPGYRIGQRSFNMNFSLDDCKTKKNGEVYTNVLVLQHDKELIMPGDAAFSLECDFNKPRDITVSANLHNQPRSVISRISLTDADPGAKHKRAKRSTIESEDDAAEITPEKVKSMSKTEL
ncbi:PREDICTED: uncharacterized protein LOC108568282 [Nicrophorus vespilloides]|uniref:Uncharacterized protein LOC108568282 n=1 Tax=Nicrophorus vespilloides TaxID=110193 RepID=A0ABM1ND53_NICVS|nr:PREDICTED: uncharacterized protein LOC108568282 [Nicrophorus vespilloides]